MALTPIWPPKNSNIINTKSGTPRMSVVYTVAVRFNNQLRDIFALAVSSPNTIAKINESTAN